jgi:hypothetical protein
VARRRLVTPSRGELFDPKDNCVEGVANQKPGLPLVRWAP